MSCKVVMVTSFKGGVGKSTVAANLALRLAVGGKRTLLCDCDFRMRSLDILLGLENEIVYDAGDVLSGKVDIKKAVIYDAREGNLMFLPAPFNYQEGVDKEVFASMIEDAKESFSLDYIVLDTPGSSGEEFSAAAYCSDMAYIVATHSFPSIRAAECTGKELEELGVGDRKLIINMFDTTGRGSNKKPTVVDIIDKTNLKLIGIVPYDSRLVLMQDNGEMIDTVKECNIAKAFSNICKRTEGKNVPLFTGFKSINRRRLLNN